MIRIAPAIWFQAVSFLAIGTASQWTAAGDANATLWYRQPATKWVEALPLGNGRLGAMVFGGTEQEAAKERLRLNEESLWAGEPTDAYPDQFTKNLREVQSLVLEGKIAEAHALGLKTLHQSPTSFRSYEPLADLWIDMPHDGRVHDYRRELDLETGLARVTYRVGQVRFQREALISAVDDVMAIRLSTDRPGALRAAIRMTRKKDAVITAAGQNQLHMDGQIVDVEPPAGYDDNPGGSGPGGKHMKFAGRLLATAEGGTIRSDGDSLVIDDANEAVILFTAATDYCLDKMNFDRAKDPAQESDRLLEAAARKPWSKLLQDHTDEHSELFNRVGLDLGRCDNDALSTDQRLAAAQHGDGTPGMAALYFQYGRYLLMSSSRRPGRLPANLQGIWSDQMWAAWEADYHLNINLQMNYWPVDLCNLSETIDPLVDWLEQLSVKGHVSADRLYDADGWVSFHATNPFGRTTPSGSTASSQFVNGVLDPLAGTWMAMTLWRHYEFTQDKDYLRDRAYPILKGASQFLLDVLVDDNGVLVIVPSTSPENEYIHPVTGKPVRITKGSTYHTSIVRVMFQAVIDASEILDCDASFRNELKAALAKLPPMQIGADGTIQEWIEDYKEREPGHRHVSHLIGLYPFSLITEADPRLWEAARKTIERRGFGGDVGWSNAWKTCFYARLHDGEQAHWYFQRLLGKNALPNLMDGIFPGRLFQIDGNLAGTTGIAEMLVQSHAGDIDLLPALPRAWPTGSVTGLRARGGFEVDVAWQNGRLTSAAIRSIAGRNPTVRYGDQTIHLKLQPGQSCTIGADLTPK